MSMAIRPPSRLWVASQLKRAPATDQMVDVYMTQPIIQQNFKPLVEDWDCLRVSVLPLSPPPPLGTEEIADVYIMQAVMHETLQPLIAFLTPPLPFPLVSFVTKCCQRTRSTPQIKP